MNRQDILKILWTIAVLTRGLTGTLFVLGIFWISCSFTFELKDLWYYLRPLFFTSLVFHLIYILVYFIFSKI